ncbi:MAG: heme-degrading domain-containing protein [Eubacteriales bacterium]|nr:heme-degrading domain-containing protein [Eubacteriales bacterium]
MAEDYAATIEQIRKQEEELVFDSFTYDDAFALGCLLYVRAKEKNLPLTVDITRNGQQLFHAALPGTSPDNDQWIIRKNRVVSRMHKSSFQVGCILKEKGQSIEEQFLISSFEYAAHGGAFPLTVKDCGVIGTISVSGLPQECDHRFVTDVIAEYLNSKKAPSVR